METQTHAATLTGSPAHLAAALKTAALYACTDPAKINLHRVRIDAAPDGGAIFTATDSYTLARVTDPSAILAINPDDAGEPAEIDPRAIPEIVRIMTQAAKTHARNTAPASIELAVNATGWRIRGIVPAGIEAAGVQHTPGAAAFPNYAPILEHDYPAELPTMHAAEYLVRLGKAAEILAKPDKTLAAVRIVAISTNKPMHAEIVTPSLVAHLVHMPQRIS